MKKHNIFSVSLITILVLSLLFIGFYFNQFDIKNHNITNLNDILLTLFGCSVILVGIIEIKPHKTLNSILSVDGLLISSLSLMLVLSIFQKQIGIYATAFFVLSAFIYAFINWKIYVLNKIYLLIFAYAILELFGTIGTPKGFRFPEMTYSFYILPLAFCCFHLEKETLLHILRFVFRIMLVFMTLSIINWYYNILHTDIKIIEWLTKKVFVNITPAYDLVCSWSHYKHPSYINLVLLPILISGFYIRYKKFDRSFISNFELALYTILCVFFQLIMESRFGLVGVTLLLIISGLYYLHLKIFFFKVTLFLILTLGGVGLIIFENSSIGYFSDPVRKTDSALALNYIKKNIWWGAGYQQEASVLRQQEKELEGKLLIISQPKTYTHNQLLGTMVQFGVIGAIVLLLMMIGLLWYSFRSRNYLLQMYIFLYIIFMLIEEPLYVQEGITRFMVFLTFFIHLNNSDKAVKVKHKLKEIRDVNQLLL
jgi:hypothetical protein